VHGLRTVIVAPDGKVYKVYRGNEWKPEELVKDLGDIFKSEIGKSG
jgi:protein SCO1